MSNVKKNMSISFHNYFECSACALQMRHKIRLVMVYRGHLKKLIIHMRVRRDDKKLFVIVWSHRFTLFTEDHRSGTEKFSTFL